MKNPTATLIGSIGTIITASIFLIFPVFFLTITTDFYTFPKQILIVIGSLLLFILWGVKAVAEKRLTIQMNPLNVPILLFITILTLSTFFSVSYQDALIQSVPVILLGLFFFTTVNFIKDRSSFTIVVTSLLIGTILSALLSIFANFGIYLLPFEQVNNTGFNTHGSPVQYLAFILPIFVICASSLINIIRTRKFSINTKNYPQILQVACAFVLLVGISITTYQIIMSPQKPILLPFNHGFQVALAAISQDTQRIIPSLLIGSGYGTFSTDFTRYISPAFNSLPYWNLTFAFSSSYILELLATTGVLGFASFIFIIINFIRGRGKHFTNPLFLGALTVVVLSLVIPFSYSAVFLLFALLALFASYRSIENAKGFDSLTLDFLTLKRGNTVYEPGASRSNENILLTAFVLTLSVVLAVYVLFFLVDAQDTPRKGYAALISSDLKFAKSFTPEAIRSGSQTFELQTQAIAEYPFRSDYHRLFSQINLTAAANLVASQQGQQPDQNIQNNIVALLQNSINSARQAVTLSRLSALNWQNLGQIYRNLIGVGEGADRFAIATYEQALALHPANPGLRIELGGVYYQLKQWDLALSQFDTASKLKPDYANAYYNLGHAYEEKGDNQSALTLYQTVRQLVQSDKANLDKINSEIAALQGKIDQNAQNQGNAQPAPDNTQLDVNKPTKNFPPRDPKVTIAPPPSGQPSPIPSSGPAPSGLPRTAISPTPGN